MLVSVIIPTYNRGELLQEAIESVIKQTYGPIEILVVDDGSDENIEDIVNKFNYGDITYIKHELNRGANIARNTGIKHAEGEYIAFLDSDDQWRTDKIEKQVKKLEETNENTVIVYCDYFEGYSTSSRLLVKQHDLREGDIHKDLLSGWMNIMTSQILVKKECFQNVGRFDPTFPSYQEYDLLARMAKKYTITYVDERLVIKNTGNYNQIGDNYNDRFAGLEMFLENHKSDMIEYFGSESVKEFSGRRLARTYRSKVCNEIEKRDIREGVLTILESNGDLTNWKIVDLVPLIASLMAGSMGRNVINMIKFEYDCHKYGFIYNSEVESI